MPVTSCVHSIAACVRSWSRIRIGWPVSCDGGCVRRGAVDVVGTGPDAVWMATDHPYRGILLDVMLPGFAGFEVCRRLREQDCSTPVLMLTARDDVTHRVRGLDCGADDYLTKPFTFVELTARLRALARREPVTCQAAVHVGDLVLNPVTRRVWRGTAEVELSAKEFAVLELLMRHPGQVLSRSQILEHVWDLAFDGVSNVVDQYVGYLRRKVDRPFGRHDLVTVRGSGYRLAQVVPVPGAPD